MENAVEALKIAAGVLLFVLALTVSISCFSQANRAVTSIVSMRDRDTQILYDQIKPSNKLTRRVGVETIIPTMYKALDENIDIQFKDKDEIDIPIWYELIQNKDNKGCYIRDKDNQNNEKIITSITDAHISNVGEDTLGKEKILDIILYGNGNKISTKFDNIHYHTEGLYKFLKDKTFEEQLGEYYPIETTNSGSTSTQIKKRVITYKVVDQ